MSQVYFTAKQNGCFNHEVVYLVVVLMVIVVVRYSSGTNNGIAVVKMAVVATV